MSAQGSRTLGVGISTMRLRVFAYLAHAGEGVLTVIDKGEKRSYTVRQGDVIVSPAGSIRHLTNTDGQRKMILAKIQHTISVPGQFQVKY
jgi:mannose-6-phosphate isomerase-like protein (cupin superfamily)